MLFRSVFNIQFLFFTGAGEHALFKIARNNPRGNKRPQASHNYQNKNNDIRDFSLLHTMILAQKGIYLYYKFQISQFFLILGGRLMQFFHIGRGCSGAQPRFLFCAGLA